MPREGLYPQAMGDGEREGRGQLGSWRINACPKAEMGIAEAQADQGENW